MSTTTTPLPAAVSRDSSIQLERATAILQKVFQRCPSLDFAIRLWDGSYALVPVGTPRFTLVIQHPGALRRMLLPPSELNLGEAYIFGDFDIEGDLVEAAGLADYLPQMGLGGADLVWLTRQLLALPRTTPAKAARPRLRPAGQLHSRRRDRAAVQFHYDVSNAFYALWLDERMVYSCAYFMTGNEDIHTAQHQKLDHLCRKLRLQPEERLLDIGCGWGGLAIYAAQHYGVEVTGITLSENQLALARQRIAEAGVADRCQVHLLDHRDMPTDSRFDKLVSVGMFEHVGSARLEEYFARAWRLLRPGGLFLNHGIGRMSSHVPSTRLIAKWILRPYSFMDRYVFPDGELLDLHQTLQAAEGAGFEVVDVENLRPHYALTLRHWIARLQAQKEQALHYVDEPTYRVWHIYMAAAAHSFERSKIGVYQALLSKNETDSSTGIPLTRVDYA